MASDILIVDDEPDIRELVAGILQERLDGLQLLDSLKQEASRTADRADLRSLQ